MNYKQFNSIIQPINFLKNLEAFCVRYKVLVGCSICTNPIEKLEYLEPCIHISLKDFLAKKHWQI